MTAGAEVSVEVTNQDSIEHNFTFAEANANQDVEGGEDATVTFTAPAAGSYEFFCKYHPRRCGAPSRSPEHLNGFRALGMRGRRPLLIRVSHPFDLENECLSSRPRPCRSCP